jgi:hypothetical protein
MGRKKVVNPYWEITTDELRGATKEFDEEFVADKAGPLTAQMRGRWQRAKNKKRRTENGEDEKMIVVRLENVLLQRCNALAKKKGISRDALIVRGLKALLAAEGQI